MRCNIDQKGRHVRMVLGIVLVMLAVMLACLTFFTELSPWVYIPTILLFAGGAFAIFEARKGWCAVRAMGLRTPL